MIVFTAPGCTWCTTAKKYLKEKKIKFTVIDITKNKNAARDCQKNGCKGLPSFRIDTQWISGFDKSKINKILGIK